MILMTLHPTHGSKFIYKWQFQLCYLTRSDLSCGCRDFHLIIRKVCRGVEETSSKFRLWQGVSDVLSTDQLD